MNLLAVWLDTALKDRGSEAAQPPRSLSAVRTPSPPDGSPEGRRSTQSNGPAGLSPIGRASDNEGV